MDIEKTIDYICKYLHTYYDTNALRTNDNMKDFFIDVVKNSKNKKHNTLAKLISNINKPRNIVQEITGPYSLTLHTSKDYAMNVYVFGEAHTPITSRTNMIHEYLYDLLKNSSVFIDFFLEYYKSDKKYQMTRNYMDKLRDKFHDCIRVHSSCAILDTSRTHYFDIRDLDNTQNKLSRFFDLYNVNRYKPIFHNNESDKKLLIEITSLDTTQSIEKFVKDQIPEFKRMEKELKKTRPEIAVKLKEFMENRKKQILKPVKKSPSIINNISKNKKLTVKDREHVADLYIKLLDLEVLYTDIYSLARVFKRFDVKKDNTQQPEYAHNVIMYAGNDHSVNYREFLSIMGYTLKILQRNNDGVKLVIPKQYQPLFSPESGVITVFKDK